MEKKVLEYVHTNRIEVTIGDEPRIIVLGMRTMERVAKALSNGSPQDLTSLEGFTAIVFEGMRKRPSDLTNDELLEWLDDMDKSERERLKEFVMEQLGFMMNEYLDGIELINKTLNENQSQSQKA